MQHLTQHLELQIPESLYLKNPRETAVGISLLEHAATMIASQGIDSFTFRKLSAEAGCTEATVYRYFENKHQLLLYILNIYWGWLEYQLVFDTHNLTDPAEKLKRTISLLADPGFDFMSNKTFARHVIQTAINEGVKVHITRHLKEEIRNGAMSGYFNLVNRISIFVSEHDGHYPYPTALATGLIDASLQQLFYQKHIRGISEAADDNKITDFLIRMIPKKSHKS